jgi:phosphatidylethanolamine/phosphatidyl-N-methylethanolamine N-methyltransferase
VRDNKFGGRQPSRFYSKTGTSRTRLASLRTAEDFTAHQMDEAAVREAYRRWAPVYDYTFGKVSTAGRRHAVEIINASKGNVLEVGVGTGLSLPEYKPHLSITGIDLAPEMLDKARERVTKEGLTNVAGLHVMDAGDLQFPDASFDTVVAMYVITVVPDPEKVMRELARVVKPGGEVMLVNHFSQDDGVRGWVERRMAPFADLVGWHSVFNVSRVMVCDDLKLMDRQALRPLGLFTMMRFRKEARAVQHPIAAE